MAAAEIGKGQLAQKVAEALHRHEALREVPIDVVDEAGVITLTGTVNTLEAKEAASSIAEEIPGVLEVINDLEVEQAPGEPEELSDDSPFDEEAPALRIKST